MSDAFCKCATTKSTRVPENDIEGIGIKPNVVQDFDGEICKIMMK